MSELSQRPQNPVVGEPLPHESAALHVTGEALYTDDLAVRTHGILHAHPVQAPHAHARVTRARFAFGGVAATPLRVGEAERAAEGAPWTEAAVERVQRILDRTLQPLSDHRGSREYRLEVAKALVEKFWVEVAA